MIPAILRKGTRIRIGPRPNDNYFNHTAVGLEFVLPMDIKHAAMSSSPKMYEKPRYPSTSGRMESLEYKVLVNPNGWHSPTLIYNVNLEYDEILNQTKSEIAKSVLGNIND